MLVWINGAFGGGKTQTAFELQRRLAGSVVCDPEVLGFGLRRMMPAYLRGNFQDLAAWRFGVIEVLDLVLGRHDGDVIVPMTVVEVAYLREILGALGAYQVRHFALLAERGTVLRRLRGRSLPLRRERFAEGQLDECLERLRGEEFGEHVWTDQLSVPEVAERIAGSAGLTLAPATDGALRARARRTWITVKHIRVWSLPRKGEDVFVYSCDDVLGLLDGLLESRDGAWWDGFFADTSRAVPFFTRWPDENLAGWFGDGLLTRGRVLELGCGQGRLFGLVCFRPEGGSGFTDQQVYERASLGGGLGYTEEHLRALWDRAPFSVRVLRQMNASGGPWFGEDFLWVLLGVKDDVVLWRCSSRCLRPPRRSWLRSLRASPWAIRRAWRSRVPRASR